MANCLTEFNNEVDKLVDRFTEVYLLPNRLSKIYGERVYVEDLLFAGLIFTGCSVYKHPEGYDFIGVCGDKALDLRGVLYESIMPGESLREVFHKLLVENYFMSMPRMSILMWRNLRERTYFIYLTHPTGWDVYSTVGAYLSRLEVAKVAKSYGLSIPTIVTNTYLPFGETGSFIIDLGTCRLTRVRREFDTDCPENLTTSEGFCKLLDAILEIFKEAVELYGKVLNNGVKALNLYLLY